jgi:Transposase
VFLPLGVKGFRYRRVKNDVRDAGDLADLLRMGRLPEAWIAPPKPRKLRELVRYRAKLVAIRSGLKAQIHAVLAKAGVLIAVSDVFGVTGWQRLAHAAGPRLHRLSTGATEGRPAIRGPDPFYWWRGVISPVHYSPRPVRGYPRSMARDRRRIRRFGGCAGPPIPKAPSATRECHESGRAPVRGAPVS